MPNMTVTFEPTQVTGLTAGSKYFFQNQGGATVRLVEATAAPARSSKDGPLLAGRSVDRISEVQFVLTTGNNLYAFTEKSVDLSDLWWNEVT